MIVELDDGIVVNLKNADAITQLPDGKALVHFGKQAFGSGGRTYDAILKLWRDSQRAGTDLAY